jgi:hypothetical protein
MTLHANISIIRSTTQQDFSRSSSVSDFPIHRELCRGEWKIHGEDESYFLHATNIAQHHLLGLKLRRCFTHTVERDFQWWKFYVLFILLLSGPPYDSRENSLCYLTSPRVGICGGKILERVNFQCSLVLAFPFAVFRFPCSHFLTLAPASQEENIFRFGEKFFKQFYSVLLSFECLFLVEISRVKKKTLRTANFSLY